MNNNTINTDNWTFCHFKAKNLKALITFGASPSILDDSFQYYTTVLDEDHNEVFQAEFSSLDDACSYINNKYGEIWNFVDSRVKKSEGGCSTCVAH